MNLSKDFREFINLLNDNNVEFLIVGGYAVGFYGYVRFTGDLDIWINPEENNANRLIRALDQFGFGSMTGISAEDFLKEDAVVQLGYPPLRIDLMTSASGVTFRDCFKKKEISLIDGLEVPFIDLESLKRNKSATHRQKDLGDLENLP